jgi:hypothetical protein
MNPYLIADASDLVLENGMKLSETREGKAVLEMAREYAKQQDVRSQAPRMPVGQFVARKEDMSPNGRLRLIKEEDGDICVAVIEDDGTMTDVQFCTFAGGGKSPRTLEALEALALAMLDDNQATPSRATDR